MILFKGCSNLSEIKVKKLAPHRELILEVRHIAGESIIPTLRVFKLSESIRFEKDEFTILNGL